MTPAAPWGGAGPRLEGDRQEDGVSPEPMIAYLGASRSTEVAVDPVDLGCGVGEVPCFECGGDGDWTKFYPEPETLTEPLQCVTCKGTGRVLVAV